MIKWDVHVDQLWWHIYLNSANHFYQVWKCPKAESPGRVKITSRSGSTSFLRSPYIYYNKNRLICWGGGAGMEKRWKTDAPTLWGDVRWHLLPDGRERKILPFSLLARLFLSPWFVYFGNKEIAFGDFQLFFQFCILKPLPKSQISISREIYHVAMQLQPRKRNNEVSKRKEFSF